MLREHGAVRTPRCSACPTPVWGEQVAAVVCPVDGQRGDPVELDRWVRARLASYKVPRRWAFPGELPRTPSGKVQKFLLRELFSIDDRVPTSDRSSS